jgi:hypothetical protein
MKVQNSKLLLVAALHGDALKKYVQAAIKYQSKTEVIKDLSGELNKKEIADIIKCGEYLAEKWFIIQEYDFSFNGILDENLIFVFDEK